MKSYQLYLELVVIESFRGELLRASEEFFILPSMFPQEGFVGI
jgi:hypothetical protein